MTEKFTIVIVKKINEGQMGTKVIVIADKLVRLGTIFPCLPDG